MKKNYLIPALILSFAFIWSSCEDDDLGVDNAGDIQVTFKAEYDGQPLVQNTDYDYDGVAIKINEFNLFISEMSLIVGDNNPGELELSEVQFVDLAFPTEAEARAGTTLTGMTVETGNYSGLRFGVGVTSDKNGDFTFNGNHPLNQKTHQWTAWNSYIFSKLEGQVDTDADGETDANFALHTGRDDAYTVLSLDKTFDVANESVQNLTVTFDIKTLFKTENMDCDADQNHYLDLTNSDCTAMHTEEKFDDMLALMNNFLEATIIE